MDLPVLPYGTPLTGEAAGQWAVAILDALKAPATEANIFSFAGWFAREGGGGENNPMNTTLGSEYPAINSDGVRNFPTPDVGVAMTVQTLEGGYANVIASFRAGTGLGSPDGATQAELLKWSGGGYSSITPVPVPVPKPEPSMHYDRFAPGRERAAVRRYDTLIRSQHRNMAQIRAEIQWLRVLKTAVWVAAHRRNPLRPDWATRHRGWRYQELALRCEGRVVEPS